MEQKELGSRLRAARERTGLTQLDVARMLNITNSSLSNYERGTRDPGTILLSRLAGTYRVSADYLLGRVSETVASGQQPVKVLADEHMSSFSDRLRQLRKTKGITQEGLALELGASRSTVAGYEAPSKEREPDFAAIQKIAKFFQVSADYLLGLTDDPRTLTEDDNAKPTHAERFAEALRRLREGKGLYQKQLADLIGLERSTITAYETGKRFPEHENLARIADFFKVSVDHLLGRANEPRALRNHKAEANEEDRRGTAEKLSTALSVLVSELFRDDPSRLQDILGIYLRARGPWTPEQEERLRQDIELVIRLQKERARRQSDTRERVERDKE